MTGLLTLRNATLEDADVLRALIQLCTKSLSSRDYDEAQQEAALAWVFGVDTVIIQDGTYYIVECDGALAGCGGWSKRQRPFGGDTNSAMNTPVLLDPKKDAAIIRAFFVHPEYNRRGIGRLLLEHSEAQAETEGFTRLETTATLTGFPLYSACGYEETERVMLKKDGYADFPAVKMRKPLS